MFGWRTVFVGPSKENFEHVKRNLEKGGIGYRVKVKGEDAGPRQTDSADGKQTAPVSGNASYYYIYVKKADEEHAKEISK